MARREKMSRRHSNKVYRKGATNMHPKNLVGPGMRGGIRL